MLISRRLCGDFYIQYILSFMSFTFYLNGSFVCELLFYILSLGLFSALCVILVRLRMALMFVRSVFSILRNIFTFAVGLLMFVRFVFSNPCNSFTLQSVFRLSLSRLRSPKFCFFCQEMICSWSHFLSLVLAKHLSFVFFF